MRRGAIAILLLAGWLASAAVIDRVAVIVGATEGTRRSIIKDSDIDRDIRFVSLLNGEPLDFSSAARKKSADRLIDQIYIRREIEMGDYPTVSLEQADQQLDRLEKEKFRTAAAFTEALRKYGLTELDVRLYFQWQLTILRFIEVRFKPAVIVTDDDIDKYYREHAAELRRTNPGKSLDDLRDQIRDTLTGERVNQEFFGWLDEQRKTSKIKYREESLS